MQKSLPESRAINRPHLKKLECQGPYINTVENSTTKASKESLPLPIVQKPKLDSTSDWFKMPAPELTDEIKRDLAIIRNRSVLDPKRHYKKDNTLEKIPKFFGVGTIIGSHADYYSRIPKKQQGASIIGELMADTQRTDYFKRKWLASQEKKMRDAPAWLKAKLNKRKRR